MHKVDDQLKLIEIIIKQNKELSIMYIRKVIFIDSNFIKTYKNRCDRK